MRELKSLYLTCIISFELSNQNNLRTEALRENLEKGKDENF